MSHLIANAGPSIRTIPIKADGTKKGGQGVATAPGARMPWRAREWIPADPLTFSGFWQVLPARLRGRFPLSKAP